MQNLEQKRAAHALNACKDPKRFRTKNDSDVVKPMTTMVLDCGILSAMAFALDNSDQAYLRVFETFIDHRGSKLPVKDYLKALAESPDASMLRIVTAEFMAYVRYLRRFANMKGV